MKKQTMVSVLSFTAALAGPVLSFPQYALAQSSRIEKQFAKEFALMSTVPVQYTNPEGLKIRGRIYLKLDQTPFTPIEQNNLHGEMSGVLYFESDEAVEKYFNGELHKTWVALAGDSGNVLVDLTNEEASGYRRYQIFGCDSTLRSCKAEQFNLYFDKKTVEMSFQLPAEFKAYISTEERVNGKEIFDWAQEGFMMLKEIPVPKQ